MTDVTDSEMSFIDECKYRLDIRIGADSFIDLRRCLSETFGRIGAADSVAKMLRVYGYGSGEDGPSFRVAIKFRDDKETRIQELRDEADKLEAELKQERGSQ